MKIRFLKTVSVDILSPSGELSDHSFNKWDEIDVIEIHTADSGYANIYANIHTADDRTLLNVPVSSFQQLTVEKRTVII